MDDIRLPEPAAGIGHNMPPEPIAAPLTPEQVVQLLDATHATLLARRDELLAGVARFLERHPSWDSEDVHAAATDNLELLRKLAIGSNSLAEQRRVIAKEPFLEGGRAVDAWFKAFAASVIEARARLNAPALAYAEKLAAERQRKAEAAAAAKQAEAERLAREAERTARPEVFDAAIKVADQAEAAAKLAAAKPGVHSRTTGLYGATSSLRSRWVHKVTDPAKVERHLCWPDDRLIRAAIAAGLREAPGLEITEERTLGTRS